jgi:tetratricopeptide (TPR) repeat protein
MFGIWFQYSIKMASFSLNGQAELGGLRKEGLSKQQEVSGNRLVELEALIEKCSVQNDKLESQASASAKSDWTQSYSYWSQWEDVEELHKAKEVEEENFSKLLSRSADFMGHTHDHAKERNIFYLPEAEKMIICERHRRKGNFLFYEGIYPKAAEQYQIALSYYEYCFPEKEEDQIHIESIRHACLCNISLCCIKMGEYRRAVESASHVIKEDVLNSKAYFRRAQGYRGLEEFALASEDLSKSAELSPLGDREIQRELRALGLQRQLLRKKEQAVAQAMLGTVSVAEDKYISEVFAHEPCGNEYWSNLLDVSQALEPVLPSNVGCMLNRL